MAEEEAMPVVPLGDRKLRACLRIRGATAVNVGGAGGGVR